MEMLRCYASGNGCLDFVWINEFADRRIASGRIVTLDEAKDYLQNNPKADHLRNHGWKVVVLNNRPVLIAGVNRVDSNTLCLNNKVYRYRSASETPATDFNLVIEVLHDNEVHEVKNISTRAIIQHFLIHEEALKNQSKD